MRGKVHRHAISIHGIGITPAYAGKSGSGRCHALWRGDHPRACGEKAELIEHICDYWGLPPRMRGKGVVHVFVTEKFGITPAYAGKSRYIVGFDTPIIGSPPRMRGKGKNDGSGKPTKRITPAYAGKRRCIAAYISWFWDHPRVCGEKSDYRTWLRNQVGSPPHMRGKACASSGCACAAGITPAYAEKRLKRSRSTVSPVAIVPLFPSVCNKPVVSDGSPASRPSQFPPRITVISPRP